MPDENTPSLHRSAPPHKDERLSSLDHLATWMDSRFRLPGTQIRFGFDSILGLIPGIGDSVTVLSNVYIIGWARAYGAPVSLILKMIWNMMVDWIVGLVPVIGDIFDIGWKANSRNVSLLKNHIKSNT